MTAEEFVQARARLGWSTTDVAARYNLTPKMVTAIEAGSLKPPREVAQELALLVAVAERQALMEASGLPECLEYAALTRWMDDAAWLRTASASEIDEKGWPVERHTESCPVCLARAAYLDAHAPPLPAMPMDRWTRAVDGVLGMVQRLPRFIRPPEGGAGEGRRTGLLLAAALSLYVVCLCLAGSLWGLAHGDYEDVRHALALLLAVPVSYFVGFYLAGAAFDATRRIRHRFAGYVVRGGLAAAAAYGVVGLMLPLVDEEATWSSVPSAVGFFAVLGCIVGAVLWIVHRIKGTVPRPLAREPLDAGALFTIQETPR